MTRIIQSLAEISSHYDVLYCDLWGCLHNGVAPYPAAVAALQHYRAQGGKVVLLTNSPRPRPAVRRQLEKMGLPADTWDDIVTSGDAAQTAMIEGAVGHRVYHIGVPEHGSFFGDMATDVAAEAASLPPVTAVPLTEAEGIVCTGLFDERRETPEDYRPTLLYAKAKGLKLLCANPDIVVDHDGTRIYCAGAIAQAYDQMGGTSLYFGKPHPPIYDLAARRLAAKGVEMETARILAIGDGIHTDVLGAGGEGIDALFVTGGLAAAETMAGADPDPARLEAFLNREKQAPRYSIGMLR